MKVKVKYTNSLTEQLYLKASKGISAVPFKTYDEDFCYDVVATSCEEVAPNVYKYGIGLAFQIERGLEPLLQVRKNMFGQEEMLVSCVDLSKSPIKLSLDLRPRSSVWKTGMSLSNGEGTVDELFRGEASAVFYHLIPNMPKYEVGDKIGQIKIGITLPIQFEEVTELNKTERGDGGYGSTGK